jgi:hypothetical protein
MAAIGDVGRALLATAGSLHLGHVCLTGRTLTGSRDVPSALGTVIAKLVVPLLERVAWAVPGADNDGRRGSNRDRDAQENEQDL